MSPKAVETNNNQKKTQNNKIGTKNGNEIDEKKEAEKDLTEEPSEKPDVVPPLPEITLTSRPVWRLLTNFFSRRIKNFEPAEEKELDDLGSATDQMILKWIKSAGKYSVEINFLSITTVFFLSRILAAQAIKAVKSEKIVGEYKET